MKINPHKNSGLTFIGIAVALAILILIIAGIMYIMLKMLDTLSRIGSAPDQGRPITSEEATILGVNETNVVSVQFVTNTFQTMMAGSAEYTIEFSTNLVDWSVMTNWVSPTGNFDWAMPIDDKPCGFFKVTTQLN